MNYLKVLLWNKELGRLVWDRSRRLIYFMFNPDADSRPDVSPVMHPASGWNRQIPIYGDSRRIYQGLPPFIADSLPDAWGNRLFDRWLRQNHITGNAEKTLYKLMFIGRRGMGALEFEPAAEELVHRHSVDLDSLYRMALEISDEREAITVDGAGDMTFRTLLSVGTSAGGRQMKAIVAINPDTGEIRSGQCSGLPGFEYCIIKFEDELVPTSEIEMAYYEMARTCGIEMEECRLLRVDGTDHFITRRFDRKDGRKIHTQTLAAINPEADSYESLMETCRTIGLSETELSEVFRRLVFNVMANNTDDHNKNFSFLLEEGGKWMLSPAYDMTFIFDTTGARAQNDRCMSLYGKLEGITKEDLLEFARENSIKNAEEIMNQVAEALAGFPALADKYEIPSKWRLIMQKTIDSNLASFGYAERRGLPSALRDKCGNTYSDISISVNSKGYYEIKASVNGRPRRRFVRPGNELYESMQRYDAGMIADADASLLMARLFSRAID